MQKYDKSIKLMIISLLIFVNNYFIPLVFIVENKGYVHDTFSFSWIKNIINLIGIGFFMYAIYLIVKDLCKKVIQFFKN